MERKEYEMPDEYKQHLAQHTECLEAREEFRQQIRDGLAAGVRVSAADKAMVDEKLREFDRIIDRVEKELAEEYERYQAEMAKEAEFAARVAEMYEQQKHIYILIKHETPHLLDSFTERVLSPMPKDMLEEFYDDVAILEATQLDAILNGEV